MKYLFLLVSLMFSSNLAAQSEKPSIMVLEFEASAKQIDSAKLLQAKLVSIFSKDKRFTTLDIVDVQKGLELESQKALVSKKCDISSCLAELANAFGADYVLHGRFGTVGSRSVISMQLYDASKTKSVARVDKDAADSGAFLSELETMADELITQEFGIYAPLESDGEREEISSLVWSGGALVAGAGVGALLSGGAALYGESVLRNASSSREAKDAVLPWVVPLEVAALVFVGGGALGAGLLLVGVSE